MEGIGVAAVVRNLAEGQPRRADELDGVFDLQSPDHGGGAFTAGIPTERAEPAGGDADAPGKVLSRVELGVMGGSDVVCALQRGMEGCDSVVAINGTGVGGEAEQAGFCEGA